MDPHSRAPKKNASLGNEALPQDTMHLIQRPCYQRGSPCQDPAGNWTTRRPPDDFKETQTAVVWSCFLFIRSGQSHLVKHSERGKRWEDNIREWTGQSSASPRGQWRTGENRENSTLAVKGLMMMMMKGFLFRSQLSGQILLLVSGQPPYTVACIRN